MLDGIFVMFGLIIFVFAFLIPVIFTFAKSRKLHKSIFDQANKNLLDIQEFVQNNKRDLVKAEMKKCEYCGSKISENDNECVSCGAKNTKK